MSDKAIAELFAAPLAEFTSARNALVKELRKAGKTDEADRIAALHKPSKALWLVNELSRKAADDVAALTEATARVRKAQQKSLPGDELREAMKEQRAVLAKLTALVEPGLQRRIHDTLQAAAMSDPDALIEGRLEQELTPSGFDALLATGVQAAKSAKSPAPKVDEKQLARERAAAEHEAHKLDAQAKALEAAAHKASAAAAKADEAAAEAQAAVTEAQARAETAKAAAEAAKEDATKAAEEASAARDAATAAQARAKDLHRSH